MDNVKDILGKSHALFDEARALLTKEDATAEEMETVDRLMKEGKALQAKAAQLNEIAQAASELDGMAAEAKAEKEAEVKEIQRAGEFKTFGEMLHAIKVWAVLGRKDSRL